ncbi:hypothetical protein DD237_006370 [Peronospora effusa]|uniref:GAG-pre-integrase domain-containing protein n=1 Tax=Peronospora effusa TaxID=542832 RepID=A0A425CDS1_9STRA|nr:hypothetical protein DD237_006370 [Peronospora effusa]
MTPHREDLFDYKNLVTSIEVIIANGKKAVWGIRMLDVLNIPNLDHRLLSVGKLPERGLNVEFERTSCIIWNKNQATASQKKVECQQEKAQYVAYSDTDSNYDLWHARMSHLNKDALAKTQRVTTGIPITSFKTKALCIINVIKDIEGVAQPENEKEYPVEDEPMESTADPNEDVEMQEDKHEPMLKEEN